MHIWRNDLPPVHAPEVINLLVFFREQPVRLSLCSDRAVVVSIFVVERGKELWFRISKSWRFVSSNEIKAEVKISWWREERNGLWFWIFIWRFVSSNEIKAEVKISYNFVARISDSIVKWIENRGTSAFRHESIIKLGENVSQIDSQLLFLPPLTVGQIIRD